MINVVKRTRTLCSDSQMKPIAWRVATRRLIFDGSLTKPNRSPITSIHWPFGNSTDAIAETTCAATVPTLPVGEARAMRASCFTLLFVASSRASQRLA